MSTLCVIPARGGSKRIPKKNIRLFLGRPIIAYSIEAALASNLFDRVIVSTDSQEIAEVALRAGATVPFLRDADLADDFTSTHDVVKDVSERVHSDDPSLEYICCLYATAPLITVQALRQGFTELSANNASMAFSVTAFDFPILRSLKIEEDGSAQMFWPEYERSRSQDLPKAYHDAGQFYWYRFTNLQSDQRITLNGARPIILPNALVQDIDTEEDWNLAEYKYKIQQQLRERIRSI